MRNNIKTTLVICLVLALLGVGCVGAGIALGGKPSFRIDLKNRTVVADSGELVSGERTPEPFTTLEIHVSTANVTVQRGDRWALSYALSEEPTITQENGVLKLTEQSEDAINISFGGHIDSYVNVTIPADVVPEQVRISTSTGDITFADLQAETIAVDCSTGGITLSAVTAEALTLTTNTGSIELRSVTASQQAHLETNTGGIHAEALTVPGGFTAEADTGDIELYLSGSADDYALTLETATGDVTVDGADQGDSYSTGGSIAVHAETATGDVVIWFD